MQKKNRQRINQNNAIELFHAFGIDVKVMNFYQFRLSLEEDDGRFYDWYHTKGSLVQNRDGINHSMSSFSDAEKLAEFMVKRCYEKKLY